MQKFFVGAIALAAAIVSAPVFAADMPVKARPVVVDPVYDWSGFYIGAHAGGYAFFVHRPSSRHGFPSPRKRR